MVKFSVNGQLQNVDAPEDTPLLWILRDVIGLTGTKFGCGKGLCGACSIHLDGKLTRSCITPLNLAAGKTVTTIEGLAPAGRMHPLQQAWIDEDVPQCGYCQSGQIMAAAALLQANPKPSDAAIRDSMVNLCRCGTYLRIFRAIKRAAYGGAS